ncbi:TniQ family protein [Antarcticirhabdus aurantiaca]|uniref:TniQ family protein n=1 Tax=Antarcticirhabdus aurantiaca TaxID=2606717 RepID=A0ACD4NXE4_9HYPH|nr:TniQ family protein [Antarcticirhabdus aurantiaca]WAJ31287.1 TniQ family protein [Jeongeuplla avenae]
MAKLAITAPLFDGESPPSYASRLARANGRDLVRHFALDVRLDFHGVVAGRPESLDHLVHLGGCDPDRLVSWSTRVDAAGSASMRGQDLGRRAMTRSHVMVCPACLDDDLGNEAIDLEARPFGRAVWQVPGIRTCDRHGAALVRIADAGSPHVMHDFAALVVPRLGDLQTLAGQALRRPPSDLEVYLSRRLQVGAEGSAFADTLPFYAVPRLCENFGAVVCFGDDVRLGDLDDDRRHEAAAVGFSFVAEGEHGVRTALERLQERFGARRTAWGLQDLFGRFYEWLAYENEDRAYDPVREIVRRHVSETMPIGAGFSVFGEEVASRRVHSVHSLAQDHGVHPKRLRKLLATAGLISAPDMIKSDDRVLVEADRANEFMRMLSDTMSLADAAWYLNVPRPHEQLLLKAGHIRPAVQGGTDVFKDHAISKTSLDAFLVKLLAAADPRRVEGHSIQRAAKMTNCGAMEIVALLIDGRLTRVGVDPDSRGYLSVLVDVAEVLPLVRREDHGGLSLVEVQKRQCWSDGLVKALVDQGHLPSSVGVNPVNRCPQRIVLPADLEKFDATYVTLMTLARECGVHFRRLNKHLSANGVEPDPRFSEVPATVFRRDAVASIEMPPG